MAETIKSHWWENVLSKIRAIAESRVPCNRIQGDPMEGRPCANRNHNSFLELNEQEGLHSRANKHTQSNKNTESYAEWLFGSH